MARSRGAGRPAPSLPALAPCDSESLVLVGTFARSPWAALVAVLGVVLAALYVLLTYQRIFTGGTREGLDRLPDLGAREKWVVAPLLVALLVLGFYPVPALDLVREPAEVTLSDLVVAGVEDPPRSDPFAAGTEQVASSSPGTSVTRSSDEGSES